MTANPQHLSEGLDPPLTLTTPTTLTTHTTATTATTATTPTTLTKHTTLTTLTTLTTATTPTTLTTGRMEKSESGIRNPESGTGAGNENGTGTGTEIETGVNWETLKPVPDTRVEIKFKMACFVIIVFRNFQHSDRDT